MQKEESLYVKSAFCQPVERFPIWLMRQAGRYMKSYQKVREKHSFLDICTTPELACEVTLQPIETFGLDAAIIFSDILVLASAIGCPVEFHDQKGPLAQKPIQSQKDVDQLNIDAIEENLQYVFKAIALTKKALESYHVPLIGFAGSPFTVASYMVGDGQGHDLKKFMRFAFSHLEILHSLLEKLSIATAKYLSEQIKTGVDAIQIFDSWSNVLPWSYFKELSLKYLKKVIANIDNPRQVPITVFGTNNSVFYPLLQDIGAHVISFDSHSDISIIRDHIRKDIAVQGNLDPHFLLAPRNILKEQVEAMLHSMRGKKGYIFNLGHGVFPEVSEDSVQYLVELVKSFSAK